MTENELFILGGLEMQLHDILWAVHDGKNRGRSEGEQNTREFQVMVGGRGRAMHEGLRISLTHVRSGSARSGLVRVQRLAHTRVRVREKRASLGP